MKTDNPGVTRPPGFSGYAESIKQTLVKLAVARCRPGLATIPPRHIEAWMRLEYGTLDHLGGAVWVRAVEEAAGCVLASTPETNEGLAKSEGL